MTRTSFNAGWRVRPKAGMFSDLLGAADPGTAVMVPHDAMLSFHRSAEHSDGSSSGYFPGGAVEYVKDFDVPDDWREQRVSLEFQGVYRDAVVFVNGEYAGQRRNGYATFRVPLDPFLRPGEQNTIRVDARAHRDSRWYSGLGIHRDTVLIVTPLAHIAPDGIRITTPEVDHELAVVEVATRVENEDSVTRKLSVSTEVRDEHGEIVARGSAPVTLRSGGRGVVRHRLVVRSPRRWSADDPYLYRLHSVLLDGDQELDAAVVPFGVRTLRLDPVHGLRINGEVVKLRGACIHHDNGPLGAAAIVRAEERRIELLKEAGFNAVRASHNPLSQAMLDACDRLGMLVMDEAFDVWLEAKNPFDYSLDFPEWWERDIESMVAKDFNHPSVILYSIGNEIPDTGRTFGGAWSRELAEKVRSLDESRYVTQAVSGFVSVIGETLGDLKQHVGEARAKGVNDVMSEMTEFFDRLGASDLVADRTAESHSVADVAGLNYAEFRYEPDRQRFPDRVVVGSETNPRTIDIGWRLVTELPHVIGDFTWTGWDYLGEAGLGGTYYPDAEEASARESAYPWLLAWCGDIDITGHRRPASYYREIVFGLRREPYIAVRRPEHHGARRTETSWAWSDAVSSWSWNVPAGSRVEVEVYSDADEVALLLDGEVLGRAPAGSANRYRAHFDVEYRPGELTAVAYVDGQERSRTSLRTAGSPLLVVTPDRSDIRADDTDLAYLAIELRDGDGVLVPAVDRSVAVRVEGAGVLRALGSARPVTEERYDAAQCTTFDGRALAIVRPTGPGLITVTVTGDGLEPVTVELQAAGE